MAARLHGSVGQDRSVHHETVGRSPTRDRHRREHRANRARASSVVLDVAHRQRDDAAATRLVHADAAQTDAQRPTDVTNASLLMTFKSVR